MHKSIIKINKQTPVTTAIHQTNVNRDVVIKAPLLLSRVWIWEQHFEMDANVTGQNISKVDHYRKLGYFVPARKMNDENDSCSDGWTSGHPCADELILRLQRLSHALCVRVWFITANYCAAVCAGSLCAQRPLYLFFFFFPLWRSASGAVSQKNSENLV